MANANGASQLEKLGGSMKKTELQAFAFSDWNKGNDLECPKSSPSEPHRRL
jgi:hypothetical protein